METEKKGSAVIWSILSGILFIILGVYIYKNPDITYVALVYWIGFFELTVGILGAIAYAKRPFHQNAWELVLIIMEIIFGLILIVSGVAKLALAASLPYVVGTWAIIRGIIGLVECFKSDLSTGKKVFLVIMNCFTILFGIYTFISPYIMFMELIVVMGIFYVMFGVMLIIGGLVDLFSKD